MLSDTAIKVLQARYLKKDVNSNFIETPNELFRRVAESIGFEPNEKIHFFKMMNELEFMPNSPTLMNAGTKNGMLSACFVLPIEDTMESIFGTLYKMAMIHRFGGGTGFNFSHLRPKGSMVGSTSGVASGPLSFMSIYDKATDVVKQGGKRRGANMGILNCYHPDIIEFITAKRDMNAFTNFNFSVGITDDFMEAVEEDDDWKLIDPHTRKVTDTIKAKTLFDLIVDMAWERGDPAMIFFDTVNKFNPFLHKPIEACNPCGEVYLLPYESCNLGSINLSLMVNSDCSDINWDKLLNAIELGVKFLDNVITVNNYPFKEIEYVSRGSRKIGLGVMGWAELLIKLGLPYDCKEALHLADKVSSFMELHAKNTSHVLAQQLGEFPFIEETKIRNRRNATLLSIAPTGSISLICNTSSSIEPIFALAYTQKVAVGTFTYVNQLFKDICKQRGISINIEKIAKEGSIQHNDDFKPELKALFVTAHDISPEIHVHMQSAWQRHIDNAVSKTVNIPNNASLEDVATVFKLAYDEKCKGITVYRDKSRSEQTLNVG